MVKSQLSDSSKCHDQATRLLEERASRNLVCSIVNQGFRSQSGSSNLDRCNSSDECLEFIRLIK